MNDLTNHEKLIIYNTVFDWYYNIVGQDVSPEVRKAFLTEWEDTLKVILEKLKRQGWNDDSRAQ